LRILPQSITVLPSAAQCGPNREINMNMHFNKSNCDYSARQILAANEFVACYLESAVFTAEDEGYDQRVKSACDAAHDMICNGAVQS